MAPVSQPRRLSLPRRLYLQWRQHSADVEPRYESVYLACMDLIASRPDLGLRSIFFGIYDEKPDGRITDYEGRRYGYRQIAVAVQSWLEERAARWMAGFKSLADLPGDMPGALAHSFLREKDERGRLQLVDARRLDSLIEHSLDLGGQSGRKRPWLMRVFARLFLGGDLRRLAAALRKLNRARTFIALEVRDSDPSEEIAPALYSRAIGLILFVSSRTDVTPDQIEAAARPLLLAFYDAHLMRIRAREAQQISEEIFHALVRTLPLAHVVHDGELILYANPRALELLGAANVAELNTRRAIEHVHAEDRAMVAAQVQRLLAAPPGAETPRRELKFVRLDNQVVPIEAQGVRVNYFGRPAIQLVFADISERRRFQEERERHKLYDALTGLPNRSLFLDRLDQALWRAEEKAQTPENEETVLAVLKLDVNSLGVVNERLSFGAGDALLQEIAGRLRSRLPGGVNLARLSGDSFGIFVEDIESESQALTLAEAVMDLLRLETFYAGGEEIAASVTAGIAFFPRHGRNAGRLLANSELALDAARENSGRVAVYAPGVYSRRAASFGLERRLLTALGEQHFELYYQPQFDAVRQVFFGVEALLRWNDPELGMVNPAEFIPIAEDRGLIIDIGEWALQRSLEDIGRLERKLHIELDLSVNVAPVQLEQTSFPTRIADMLTHTRRDPGRLKLELVERGALSDNDIVRHAMQELQRLGVGFHVDDFGAGRGALAYLRRAPVEAIKIDKSFTHDLERQSDFLRGLIAFARSLGLDIIVEGVETDAQTAFFRALDCRLFQGFRFARPMPLAQLEGFLASPPARPTEALN